MQDLGHVVIKRRHDLVHGLNQGDFVTGMHQVFRNLAADKTAAYHGNILRFVVADVGIQLRNVYHIPNAKDIIIADAFDSPGQDGFAAGREDQGIVCFFVFFAVREILYRYDLFFPVNGDDFVFRTHFDVIFLFELGRIHHYKVCAVRNSAA